MGAIGIASAGTTERGLSPIPVPAQAEDPVQAPLPVPFPPGVAAKLGTYVYLLVDARTGRVFFVGRGKGDRCHRHVAAARSTTDDAKGRYVVLDRIRLAESDGRPVRIDILRFGLSADEARLVEASAVEALGLGQIPALELQRRPVDEVGAALAKRARFKRSHQVVLLRAGGRGSDTPYGSVRHGWRIGRRWVDVISPRSPVWAVIVAGDLVTSVYRLDGWEPTPGADTGTARTQERWSFVGQPDSELEARYVGRSVAAYLGDGVPSAVTYVWCGPHWVNTAH